MENDHAAKPLLLIDVDGPLNPDAAKSHRRPQGYLTYRIPRKDDHPDGPPADMMTAAAPRSSLRVWLNPKHGPMLVAMADMFDLHWATAWVDNANTIIAPLIGLPELPVIRWTNYHPLDTPLTVLPPFEQTRSARAGGNRRSVERVHWKTRPIAQYTALLDDNPAGRPFVWMDDEITDADRYYLAQVGSVGPHLLHRIDPAVGMTAVDLDLMRAWAAAL